MDIISSRPGRIVTWIIFCIYLILLAKLILFRAPIDLIIENLKTREILPQYWRLNSNFVPMKTITFYLTGNPSLKIALENLLGNIAAFVPFGFLLPVIFRGMKKLKSIVIGSSIISLSFELMQLLAGVGSFDVDDILLNVTGSICGYFLYCYACRLFLKEKQSNSIVSETK